MENLNNNDSIYTLNNIITFGKYNNIPINWKIKKIDKNSILLVCENIIELMPFDNVKNIWRESSLKKWLNQDFYNNCFNQDEKNHILSYYHYDGWYEKEGFFFTKNKFRSATNIDKVCLLSEYDCNLFFNTNNLRKKQMLLTNNSNTYSCWWLRSTPNYTNIHFVNKDGEIKSCSPNKKNIGVVPIICIEK